jgi:hypothetical protein
MVKRNVMLSKKLDIGVYKPKEFLGQKDNQDF